MEIKHIAEICVTISMPLLFFIMIPMAIMNHNLKNFLRERHPEKWKELGEPGSTWTRPVQRDTLYASFFSKGDYKLLNDPDLNRQYKTLTWFAYVFMVLFAMAFPSMIIMFYY